MTILKEKNNLTGDAETNQRLRDAAAQTGVSAERILFAHKGPPTLIISRADRWRILFLDTMPTSVFFGSPRTL